MQLQVLYPSGIEIWRCFFTDGEKLEDPKKTLGAGENQQQTQPIWHRARIEVRSYRWKASTLATPPSLLYRIDTTKQHTILGGQGGARLVGTFSTHTLTASMSPNVTNGIGLF